MLAFFRLTIKHNYFLSGNEFEGELEHFTFKNISLITLEIIIDKDTSFPANTIGPRTIKFGFKPALSEAKG